MAVIFRPLGDALQQRRFAEVAAANVIRTGVVVVSAGFQAAFAEEIAVSAEPIELLFRLSIDVVAKLQKLRFTSLKGATKRKSSGCTTCLRA